MKRISRCFYTVIITLMVIPFPFSANADPPDPPNPPGGHGQGGDVGAPIDGGTEIILLLGIGYAVTRVYRNRKERE